MAETRHLYALSDALVGVLDVALWDIKGKATGTSIALLLGGARETAPAYQTAWSFRPTCEEVSDEANAAKGQGFHGYKLQIWDGPDLDVPRLRAARAAVGPDFPLMLDACGRYAYDEALAVGRVLDELRFTWFEEPLADRHLHQLSRLTADLQTPVLAGETVRVVSLAEYLRQGACDMVRGDVYIKGGITGLCKGIAASDLAGVPLEIHTAASPLLDAANVHVACGAGAGRFVETHHPVYRFGLLGSPLDPDANGYVRAPDGPGLGVELDWDWIDNNTIDCVAV
jgi:L-alanine-DL-glutamate epimerase-like enolase superfamily enzyme